MHRLEIFRNSGGVFGALAFLALSGAAWAEAPGFEPNDIESAFFISKSENQNQVHFAIHVDAHCVPRTSAPVWNYWRMREEDGPVSLEKVLPREERAYGIASQDVLTRTAWGGTVRLRLRALPDRAIVLETRQGPQGCEVDARTGIGGVSAQLEQVYVKLRWPFGIASLLMRGRSESDLHPVEEKIEI